MRRWWCNPYALAMDVERDPTDLGLSHVPDVEEYREDLRDPGPCEHPADPSRVAELVAAVRAERGWRPNPLVQPCRSEDGGCGAPVGAWCSRGRRRAVPGRVCSTRRHPAGVSR
jgi:hypothetical protein